MIGALVVGGVGLLLAMLGWLIDPLRFHFAWLAALVAWLAWPLGSLTLLLIGTLTGGRWTIVLRPALMAGVAGLPLLLPAVVPFCFGLDATYPWARGSVANAFYLNLPFFAGRGVLYLIVWFALGGIVLRQLRLGRSLVVLAPPGLVLMALTMTFAAIDLTMSLDPDYNSSVYGMIAATSACLMALSIVTVRTALAGPKTVLPDTAKIVLGIVILWAYLAFVQFLIVWESDLPKEAHWYLQRSTGPWAVAVAVYAIGTFLVPFAALLIPSVRRSRGGVAAICLWLVAMEVLRSWWLVLPAGHFAPGWMDPACLAALFGLSAAASGYAVRRAGLAHV